MRQVIRLFTVVICVALLLVGCAGRSPEARLDNVRKLIQEGDRLGARLEAKNLIIKYPESEEAVVAHYIMANLYDTDGQPDEALSELGQILSRKSQKDPVGMQALGYSIDILKRSKRFDQAYLLIDKFQKQYADDHITSLQLSVVRADVMAEAGETTPARAMLESFYRETTSPVERRQFRQIIGQTFMREKDPIAGAHYFEKMYETAPTDEDRRDIALRTAWFYAAAENYEKAREWAMKVTDAFAKAIAEQLDGRQKIELAQVVAQLYLQIGNLKGALPILRAIYDAPFTAQEQLPSVVNNLVISLLRMGKVDEAIAFVRQAAQRFPQSPLAQQAVQMETMKAQGKLDTVDTAPLVMRFTADPILTLDRRLLVLDEETSSPEGAAAAIETTATGAAAVGTTEAKAASSEKTPSAAGSAHPDEAKDTQAGTSQAKVAAPEAAQAGRMARETSGSAR
jgi:tetratricopeptide (TPR) repeat protein